MRILAGMVVVLALAACAPQGRFERAGEAVDDTIDDVREGVGDVVDDVRDTAEDVGEPHETAKIAIDTRAAKERCVAFMVAAQSPGTKRIADVRRPSFPDPPKMRIERSARTRAEPSRRASGIGGRFAQVSVMGS